jgi:hypothetical protein
MGFSANSNPNDDDISRFVQMVFASQGQHELRSLGSHTSTRLFNDASALAQRARSLDGTADCYITINPVPNTLVLPPGQGGVRDADISEVRWLLVDIDAKDQQGERDPERSAEVAQDVRNFLRTLGFPEPIIAQSGQGYWLLWRMNQDNTQEALAVRQQFTKALAAKFGGAIDTSVTNAARVVRLFGTINTANGVRSRIDYVPSQFQTVAAATLEKATQEMACAVDTPTSSIVKMSNPPTNHPSTTQGITGTALPRASAFGKAGLLLGELRARGYTVTRVKPGVRAQSIYELSPCPMHPGNGCCPKHPSEGHSRAAAIFEGPDGSVGFRCQGDSCKRESNGLPALLAKLGITFQGMVDDTLPDFEASDWFDAFAQPQYVDWLLEPFIARGILCWSFGPKGSSKSMVWVLLCRELARLGFKTTYYSQDNPDVTDSARLQRILKDVAGADEKTPARERLLRVWKQGVNLLDPQEVARIVEREVGRDLLVFDTYERCTKLDPRISPNGKASIVLSNLRHIIRKTGAGIVVVDHPGFGNPREPRDSSEKLQGADTAPRFFAGNWSAGPAPFHTVNEKSQRLANPFDIRGEIVDTADGGLEIRWQSGHTKFPRLSAGSSFPPTEASIAGSGSSSAGRAGRDGSASRCRGCGRPVHGRRQGTLYHDEKCRSSARRRETPSGGGEFALLLCHSPALSRSKARSRMTGL